jgi:hypothetical protein
VGGQLLPWGVLAGVLARGLAGWLLCRAWGPSSGKLRIWFRGDVQNQVEGAEKLLGHMEESGQLKASQ